VGGDAQVVEGLGDAAGAEQVDLDRAVERRVEGHGGRAVDHDVAAGQRGPAGVVEAEAVGADVAGDHLHPPLDGGVELGLAQLLAQPVEGVVAEDLAAGPRLHRRPLAGSDEQHQLTAGNGPQQALDQGGAEEARPARDRDALPIKGLGDHGSCLPVGRGSPTIPVR
jgi:hypothetical protein